MSSGHDFNNDPTVFDPLHRLVPGVDAELLPNSLLDCDLPTLSYSTGHDMTLSVEYARVKASLTAPTDSYVIWPRWDSRTGTTNGLIAGGLCRAACALWLPLGDRASYPPHITEVLTT